MTPAARIAAAIELLDAVETASNRPADAVANDFFRSRRYIGSGDRRAVSDRVWRVLRARRRLGWWLHEGRPSDALTGDRPPADATADTPRPDAPRVTPRLLVAASLLLEGWALSGIRQAFSGGQFAPARFERPETSALAPLEGHGLDHPGMPGAVRLEIPDWLLPRLAARFGSSLPAEMAALSQLCRARHEGQPAEGRPRPGAGRSGRRRVGTRGPTPISPWGLRIDGRRPVTSGPAFQSGLVEIQDEGSQLVAAMVGATPGMRVVDWCAGAGGKTLALAGMMENRGQIVACDVSAARLDGAVRRLRRAGCA